MEDNMLNPSSNNIGPGHSFTNLGDGPFTQAQLDVAMAELRGAFPAVTFTTEPVQRERYKEGSKPYKLARAGIYVPGSVEPSDIETVTLYNMTAEANGWTFDRRWYYWAAKTTTAPIPEDEATSFNTAYGDVVRVNGYSGGTSVKGPVDSYHIDTVEGLDALAHLIGQL